MQMFGVLTVVYHIGKVRAEVWVLETSVFTLQLEARIDSKDECIFPAYNNKREYNNGES